MTDALDHARKVVSRMTPGPWSVEAGGAIVNRELSDPVWDVRLNDSAAPAWDIGEAYAPANAAGIVLATAALRVLTDEGTVEAAARAFHEELATMYPGNSLRWEEMVEKYRREHIQAMRAALSVILELAQGEK